MRIWLLLAAASCSGGAHELAIDPTPPRMTQGTLSGPLCDGAHCKCRELNAAGDGGAGVPDDAKKRFELRLQSAQELWVKVGSDTLYKSPEQAESCFYVDLAPGDNTVVLRASNKDGVSAALAIHELGAKTKTWYETVTFNCGAPGVCSMDELAAFKQNVEGHAHRVMDLCGSVKLKGLEWATTKGPDQEHPGELQLQLVLDVYKRVPTQAHGDPSCGKGPPPKDEPAKDEPAKDQPAPP